MRVPLGISKWLNTYDFREIEKIMQNDNHCYKWNDLARIIWNASAPITNE